MSQRPEIAPGAPASVTGVYRQVNVLGTPTEAVVKVGRGEKLPRAPIGFAWYLAKRLTDEDPG